MRELSTDENALQRKAKELHGETFIFDALTTSIIDPDYAERLRRIGVNATNYTVADTSLVDGDVRQDGFTAACRKIGRWYRVLEELKDRAGLACSIAEMQQVTSQERLAVFFGFQNGTPIDDNLDNLRVFHRLGIRFIQLTYNSRNMIGNGCGERRDEGLSNFGVEAIREMNRLGIAVDLSHCHYATTMDAIEVSERPVLFTHANARALADTPRNKSDEQIRALAAKGGVMGVKHMLGDTVHKAADQTTLADVADHIDHVVNLVGIEHVAIGTDFSGTTAQKEQSSEAIEAIRRRWPNAYLGRRVKPRGFETIDGLPSLTIELLRRRYSDEDIRKLYGGNWLRVLRTIFDE